MVRFRVFGAESKPGPELQKPARTGAPAAASASGVGIRAVANRRVLSRRNGSLTIEKEWRVASLGLWAVLTLPVICPDIVRHLSGHTTHITLEAVRTLFAICTDIVGQF